jgi:hypothetical protein
MIDAVVDGIYVSVFKVRDTPFAARPENLKGFSGGRHRSRGIVVKTNR